MTPQHRAAAIILTGLLSLPLAAAPKSDKATTREDDARALMQEVAALQTIHRLDLSPAQLRALLTAAKSTASEAKERKVVKAPRFRTTLGELRDALVAGDDDKLAELRRKLDKLFDEEKVEIDDGVTITETARRQAPMLLRGLKASQVAAYIPLLEDEDLDPVEMVTDALDEGKSLTDAKWTELRNETAEEVAWLVAGANPDAAARAEGIVKDLLDKFHTASAKKPKESIAEAEEQMRKLCAGMGPMDILRHAMERELAELLSNPRLAKAVQARLAAIKEK